MSARMPDDDCPMPSPRPTFPIRLQSARESAGLSLQGLADSSGTSLGSVRLWLAGRAEPKIGNVEKLAAALKVDPRWLAFGENEP